jgi:PBSX family phage portal protein
VYLLGEASSGDAETGVGPGDREYVWEEIGAHDGPRSERGLETTSTATLSESARREALAALRSGSLSERSLNPDFIDQLGAAAREAEAETDAGVGVGDVDVGTLLSKAEDQSQQGDDISGGISSENTPLIVRSARGFIRPPYDPTALSKYSKKNGTHARCVQAKATGVAGYGFSIVPYPDHPDTDQARDDEPEGHDVATDFWFGTDTRWRLGPNDHQVTPEKVLEAVWYDYESVGWGCAEVMFNRQGDPTGMAHVPAHRIRRRHGAPGFIELDSTDRIDQYYAPLGGRSTSSTSAGENEKVFVDRYTGETASERGGVDEPATELLFIQNYNPISPHYGLPDWVSQVPTMAADNAARRYNARFFENDGVPRFAISVEGGELTERAFDNLTEDLRELSKEENAHRGILIEATQAVVDRETGANTNVNITPLTVGENEDASFTDFRQENEHDILQAHSIPPAILERTQSANYSNFHEQREKFAQGTIYPLQERLAAHLYRSLHVQVLNVPKVTLRFQLRGGKNRLRDAEIAQIRINSAGLSMKLNEQRELAGLGPLTTESGDPDPAGEMLMAEVQGFPGLAMPGADNGAGDEPGNGAGNGADGGVDAGTGADTPGTGDNSPDPTPSDTGTPPRPRGPTGTPGGATAESAHANPGERVTAADPNPDYSLFGPTADEGATNGAAEDEDMNVNITINESERAGPAEAVDVASNGHTEIAESGHRESANSSKYAQYEAGDAVEYGDGQQGMVVEIFLSSIEWPVGEDDTEDVEASESDPVYLVARASGGSSLFEESELTETDDFVSDANGGDPEELAEAERIGEAYTLAEDPSDLNSFNTAVRAVEKLSTPGVDEPGVGFSPGDPPNWDYPVSYFKAWRSLGMSHDSCSREMTGDIRNPDAWCAQMKDTVLGTERWRNRF